jgi:predicted ribosome quality control (RQC) complex YloA/Tae2 family protein
VDRDLEAEAFEVRLTAANQELKQRAKHARERARQSETAVEEALGEPDWSRYGELLKAALPTPPEPVPGKKKGTWVRRVTDFATGDELEIPADPKYGSSQQVERYFQQARRKTRRIEEAGHRLKTFQETLERATNLLAQSPAALDWAGLETLEREAGIARAGEAPTEPRARHRQRQGHRWLGKVFQSKDGLAIWVGRSRDENLELTFKHARGNDLWMHVRGKPGAHVLIPLQPGKSPPLETLLDAAALVIHYSGGERWGKTEVDYTYKKHVKRIRDSTEVSYTHNKTLIVAPDSARLKRLLG